MAITTMKRNLSELHTPTFDVLIVGGGIYGAALAREAATRGLKTALVEQADFCSGASANSLKIIHGGLRYLQQADLPRVFESIRERSILLQTAPHLASPVPCLMPTRGLGMKSRPVMAFGMLVNDILSCRRNRHLDPARRIPNGGTLSQRDALEILPAMRERNITGAARWYDGLAYDTERLAMGMIKAAVRAGAIAANYVRVTGLRLANDCVDGVHAQDLETGDSFDIQAGLVINAAGPWLEQVLGSLGKPVSNPQPHLALAMNLVIRNWPISTHALGLQSTLKRRLYFFMPWRGAVMAGTYYREHRGSPDTLRLADEDIDSYLQAINSCLPGAAITRDDILAIQLGIVPSLKPAHPDEEPALLRHYRLIDHAQDGIAGLMSVCGVKFTTARGVAEQVIDAASRKCGKSITPSPTRRTPLPGGSMPDLAAFHREMAESHPHIPAEELNRLMSLYGTESRDILAMAGSEADANDRLRAEIRFVLQEEMPLKLGDLVFRRTGLASAGLPSEDVLRICAETMGREHDWSVARMQDELAAVKRAATLWQAGCAPAG